MILLTEYAQLLHSENGEDYPSSVKMGGVNRDRLLETTPGKVFISFVTSSKYHDIPGIKLDLTEEGYLLFNSGVEGALAKQILSGILNSVEPKKLKDD